MGGEQGYIQRSTQIPGLEEPSEYCKSLDHEGLYFQLEFHHVPKSSYPNVM